MLLRFCSIIIFLFSYPNALAQRNFSHELGAFVGPVVFQSDFGERNNFDNNLVNIGFGVGIVHYMNFSYTAECNCYKPETYFNDHFKLRTEISYTRTKLEHFGRWVQPDNNSLGANQLRAMTGLASVINIGQQLEYFPLSIRDFSSEIGAFGPFIAAGAHFSFFQPNVVSSRGDITKPGVLFPKYLDGSVNNETSTTFSILGGIGTRYKLTEMSDLFTELRFQYYFSNWVEGVSPNPDRYPENKFNDWNVWLNLGYIYYLD